jgi:hypothetical protein
MFPGKEITLRHGEFIQVGKQAGFFLLKQHNFRWFYVTAQKISQKKK